MTERRKRSRLIGVHRMTSAKPKSYQKAPTVRSERKRYFFDIRDGDEIAVDEEGMVLASVQAVQEGSTILSMHCPRCRVGEC